MNYCDCVYCPGHDDEPAYVPQHPLPEPSLETRTVPFVDGVATLPDGRTIVQADPWTNVLVYPVVVAYQGPE